MPKEKGRSSYKDARIIAAMILAIGGVVAAIITVWPPSPDDSPPEISILDPEEEQKLPLDTMYLVKGAASSVPHDLSLWLITTAPGERWYPQTAVQIVEDTWSGEMYTGIVENVDGEFYIYAVLANDEAHRQLNDYLKLSEEKWSWEGIQSLPMGAKIYAQVKVTGKLPEAKEVK